MVNDFHFSDKELNQLAPITTIPTLDIGEKLNKYGGMCKGVYSLLGRKNLCVKLVGKKDRHSRNLLKEYVYATHLSKFSPLVAKPLGLFEYSEGKGKFLAILYEKGDCDLDFARSSLSLEDLKRIINQLKEFLIFIHLNKFAHNDFKARNIIVYKNYLNSFSVKVADWGQATFPLSQEDLIEDLRDFIKLIIRLMRPHIALRKRKILKWMLSKRLRIKSYEKLLEIISTLQQMS